MNNTLSLYDTASVKILPRRWAEQSGAGHHVISIVIVDEDGQQIIIDAIGNLDTGKQVTLEVKKEVTKGESRDA